MKATLERAGPVEDCAGRNTASRMQAWHGAETATPVRPGASRQFGRLALFVAVLGAIFILSTSAQQAGKSGDPDCMSKTPPRSAAGFLEGPMRLVE